jgi:hypothetical protein
MIPTMTKPKWKDGDIVRLIEPKRFVRCGYPLHLPDVAKDIADNRTASVLAAMQAFGIDPPIKSGRVIDRLASAFAYAEIRAKGFGGRTRTIYEEDFDASLPLIDRPAMERQFMVVNRFHVMTGEYYGPSGGGDDYEPGGLDKMKYNTILVLTGWWPGRIIYLNYERESSNIPRADLLKSFYCVWDIRVEKVTPVPS